MAGKRFNPLKLTALEMLDWLEATKPARPKKKPKRKDPERFSRTMANAAKKAAEKRATKAMAERRCFVRNPNGQREQMLKAMEPGAWYGMPDVSAMLPGVPRNSIKGVLALKLHKAGLVERTTNPDFDRRKAGGVQSEPRYLYRLTEKGRLARSRALEAVG